MGTGYTRNDTSNNIASGKRANAADIDGEFDAIETAFSTSGHTHDGTAAEGGAVTVLGPAQDFVADANSLSPKADGTYDLGTSSLAFDNIFVSGTPSTGNHATNKTYVDTQVASAGGTGALVAANNLSDLVSVSTARTNLGLGTAALSATGDFATAAQGALADTAVQSLSDLSVTSTAAELNKLDGATVTTTEINYLSGVTSAIQTQLDAKEAADADILKADTHDTLTAGFDSDAEALGTITSGTVTPEVDAVDKENFKTLTANGAFTLAPPSTSSNCTVIIQVTNGASAGTITTSGFTIVNGDTYETTNGNDYLFHIKKVGSFTALTIEALQ